MFFSSTITSNKVTINAPVEKVWEVLVDLDRYHEWNPYTVQIDADLNQIGSKVGLHVQMNPKNRMLQIEELRVNQKHKQLSWGMNMGANWILCAQRDQLLESIDDKTTTYVTLDKFDGLLVPLCMKMYGKDVKRGFDAIADALKQRVESLEAN